MPVAGIKHAVAIDFDPVDKFVYWSDDENLEIKRCRMNGQGKLWWLCCACVTSLLLSLFHTIVTLGGLMVSALVIRSSGPGWSPGRGHCVVFLGKILNSHSAPLHSGV